MKNRKKNNSLRFILLIIFLMIFEIFLRTIVSFLGYNNDVISYKTVSDIMQTGQPVYTHTMWYNYGPIWAYVLGIIGYIDHIFGFNTMMVFHIGVAFFLSLVDVAISLTLWKMWGKIPAVLFIINPISVLITGFHSQFDDFAILLGLWSWAFFIRSQSSKSNKTYFLSAILLGLSLATKHILFLFPLWILFLHDKQGRSLFTKLKYFAIPYVVFFLGFAVEIVRNSSTASQIIQGITANVFQYQGSYGHSVIIQLINLIFSSTYIDIYFKSMPFFKGYTFLFVLLVIIGGYILSRSNNTLKNFFPLYLITFYALSTSHADQYMAIPLVAVSIFYNRWETIVFSFVAIAYLLNGASANIGGSQNYAMHLGIFSLELPFFPWDMQSKFNDINAQAWLFIFALNEFFSVTNRFSLRSTFSRPVIADCQVLYVYAKNRLYYITITLFIVTTISILFYTYMTTVRLLETNWLGEKPVLHIFSATYGQNCNGKTGNETSEVRDMCHDLISCSYTIKSEPTAMNCKNDYNVKWTCQNTSVHPIYYVTHDGESQGANITIACPYIFTNN